MQNILSFSGTFFAPEDPRSHSVKLAATMTLRGWLRSESDTYGLAFLHCPIACWG